jgi:hypothetical protein
MRCSALINIPMVAAAAALGDVDSQCLTTIETAETNDTPNGDQRQIHGA